MKLPPNRRQKNILTRLIGRALLGISPKTAGRIQLLAAGFLILGMSAQSASAALRQRLGGHVPKAAATASLVGELSPTQNLDLAIGLPLRNRAELQDLLKKIYDPHDPQYRHFLTPDEFTARFGPTETDYRSVMDFARSQGLSVIGTHPNRALVEVRGTVADIDNTFHVNLRNYRRPDGSNFHAPDVEPSVDLEVPLSHIAGLENAVLPHPVSPRQKDSPGTGSKAVPLIGSGPSGKYMGYDFRNAYVAGTTLTGSGQVVASVQFEGFYADDIANYESQAGIPSNLPSTVLCYGATGIPDGNANYNQEVSLDIEMQVSMAPSAALYVYEGGNDQWDSVFATLASPPPGVPLARQISCSWDGWGYNMVVGGVVDYNVSNAILEFAAQGQSFYQSSGDNGAYTSDPGDNRDEPYIVLVGGTELSMNGSGASYGSETTWNNAYGASSGGILASGLIPDFQVGIPMASNDGSTTNRNAPDVSMAADNIWLICNNGDTLSSGGTSAAAPLWAGFTALVNQQAQAQDQTYLGYPNPAFYSIGQGPNYNADFNDIQDGSHNGTATHYPAVTGYDLATGWGSPKLHLIDDLVIQSGSQTPTPTGTFYTSTPTFTPTPTITMTPTVTPTFTPLPCALVIPSGASVTLADNTYNFCSINVQTGGTLVIGGSVTLDIMGFLNVDGIINGTGNGYGSTFASGSGPGVGGSGFFPSGAGGGGHGGVGGWGNGMYGGPGGVTYDSPTQPVSMGSQGGNDSLPGTTGGSGGAALVVDVPAGNVTVNGNIIMNGNSGGVGHGGGGAGGTISIDAVGIYGAGYLIANGGVGGTNGLPPTGGVTAVGGGGGGGLVRVCASNHIPFPGGVNGGLNNVQGGSSGMWGGSGAYPIGNGSAGNYYDCNTASAWTITATLTPSPTGTATFTPTPSPTSTPTPTSSVTATFTPTATFTHTSTDSMTVTPTPTSTFTPTQTATVTPTRTPTGTATNSLTPTVTLSPTPTRGSTATPSPTPGPVTTPYSSNPYPNPITGLGPVYFNVAVPGTAQVDWSVFTPSFRKIREGESPLTGVGTLQWDLKDSSGGWAANGLYYLRIQVTIGGNTVAQIEKVLIAR